MKPVIGITMGDFNGIGPEIALKSILNRSIQRCCRPLLIGSYEVFEYYEHVSHLKTRITGVPLSGKPRAGGPGTRPGIPVLEADLRSRPRVSPGEERVQAGTFAGRALETAVRAWRRGLIDAVVTSPTSKTVMHRAGYSGSGQTEILASLTGTTRFGMMLLAGD